MAYIVEPYASRPQQTWNDLVESGDNGTIFHRLDFLSYHGLRFADNEHHLAILKGTTLVGVMPMAIFDVEGGGRQARSPYGASYGGPVFARPLEYSASRQAVAAIVNYLRGAGISRLTMTLPIAPCHREYCETFRLALMEEGFICSNREISSAVELRGGREVARIVTSRARNMSRKAQSGSVRIVTRAPLEDFWRVMEATFLKHGNSPTHTFEQFKILHERFPQRIWADVAYLDQTPVAGVGYFVINPRVNSSFYLCQDPAHQACQAQSLLVMHALEQSLAAKFDWFDFGTSSRGGHGVENIFQFKESFGARGFFRETYVWSAG